MKRGNLIMCHVLFQWFPPQKNRLKAQARQKSEPMDKAAGKYIFLCDENEISKPIKIITDLNLSKTYYCKKKRLSQSSIQILKPTFLQNQPLRSVSNLSRVICEWIPLKNWAFYCYHGRRGPRDTVSYFIYIYIYICMLYIQDYAIIQCFCSYHFVLQKSVRKGLQINTMSLLGGSIPFGKWSITLVNESSKERVIPFPTGLFLVNFSWGWS